LAANTEGQNSGLDAFGPAPTSIKNFNNIFLDRFIGRQYSAADSEILKRLTLPLLERLAATVGFSQVFRIEQFSLLDPQP